MIEMESMTRTVFRKGLSKALYKLFWIFFYTFALNDGTKMIQVTLKPVKMFKYKNTTVIILKYYRLKTFNFFIGLKIYLFYLNIFAWNIYLKNVQIRANDVLGLAINVLFI